MKKLLLCAVLLCGCGQSSGPTPMEEYEQALQIYRIELQQLEEMEKLSDGGADDQALIDKQAARLERAKDMVRTAEKRLD